MSVALIIGGETAAGSACATVLRRAGVSVAQTGAGEAELVLPSAVDPADAVDRVERELGPITHLVVSCALQGAQGDLATIEEAAWRDALDRGLGTTVRACRAVLPGMRSRGGGAICAIGRRAGITGDPEAPHEAAAAGALHLFVKTLAVEEAPHGIRINCVAVTGDASAAQGAAAVAFTLLEDTNLLAQVIEVGA